MSFRVGKGQRGGRGNIVVNHDRLASRRLAQYHDNYLSNSIKMIWTWLNSEKLSMNPIGSSPITVGCVA